MAIDERGMGGRKASRASVEPHRPVHHDANGEVLGEVDGAQVGAAAGGRHVGQDERWLVTTHGSEYVLDLAAGLVRRSPVAAAGLRGDGAWTRLAAVLDLRVGYPMVLVLLLRDDGVSTIRCTSRVVRIRRLTSPPEP